MALGNVYQAQEELFGEKTRAKNSHATVPLNTLYTECAVHLLCWVVTNCFSPDEDEGWVTRLKH